MTSIYQKIQQEMKQFKDNLQKQYGKDVKMTKCNDCSRCFYVPYQ